MNWINILIVIILTAAVLIMLLWLLITIIFACTMIFGAPYVASRDDKLKTILQLIKQHLKKNKNKKIKIADLGSGNGKILIVISQFAIKEKLDVELHGYEINPLLVWYSRLRISKSALIPFSKGGWVGSLFRYHKNSSTMKQFNNKTIQQYNNIKIYNQSLFTADLSKYDIITLYATTYIMARLETKLQKELKPGAIVISNYFRFPNWKPVKTRNKVHFYRQP